MRRMSRGVLAPAIVPGVEGQEKGYSCVPHLVPATCRSLAATSISADLPSGKLPTTLIRRHWLAHPPGTAQSASPTWGAFRRKIAPLRPFCRAWQGFLGASGISGSPPVAPDRLSGYPARLLAPV
jgi:hypothetical protein